MDVDLPKLGLKDASVVRKEWLLNRVIFQT
jgi:hypothetical protein